MILRKALLAGCAVVIAVLVYDNIQRGRKIELLKAQTLPPVLTTAPVAPKAVAPVKAANMADQAACAKQAASEFKREGCMDDFMSHFSTTTGHCYMVTTSTTPMNNIPTNSRTLSDAFEGKVCGNYFWINTQGKKFWEVEPKECKLTIPNGEDKICKADGEWDSLVKMYMEAP